MMDYLWALYTSQEACQGKENAVMTSSHQSSSLAELKEGEHAFVLDLGSGRGITGRLTSMGFTPGVEIVMTQNYGHGPLVVTVRDTRVALGRREAQVITVQRSQEPHD
ncbi:MAG: ferrous iron transport protein A [Chloroflexi bacterium]|jgi:ferrous iron transport protein A|nr:ferrous iron transport protein A [Chloroflexota bacterium]